MPSALAFKRIRTSDTSVDAITGGIPSAAIVLSG
jgi:hypothetical protein